LYSLVVFLPAFAILGFFYGEAVIDLPISTPWLVQGFDLLNTATWGIQLYDQTNWFGWYFLSYLIITIIINVGRTAVKKFGVMNG